MIRSWRMEWAGHVASIEKKRKAYRILIGKPEGKRTLPKPRHKWKDNNRTELRQTGRETVKLIHLV